MQQDVVIKVTAHQLIDLSAVPCGTHDGLQAPLVWAGTTVPWQKGGGGGAPTTPNNYRFQQGAI